MVAYPSRLAGAAIMDNYPDTGGGQRSHLDLLQRPSGDGDALAATCRWPIGSKGAPGGSFPARRLLWLHGRLLLTDEFPDNSLLRALRIGCTDPKKLC